VAVGGDDHLLPRNRALEEALTGLEIAHEYEVVPGVTCKRSRRRETTAGFVGWSG